MTPAEYRQRILTRFPWIKYRGQPMVLSTDLDGLLCGLYMHNFFEWRLAGFYNLEQIYLDPNIEPRKAIWLDLDICRPEVRSVGHHILTSHSLNIPPLSRGCLNQCLNPNLERGISIEKFESKYPFATIHLLLWLHRDLSFHVDLRSNQNCLLLWLADSSWINAQRFKRNCEEWVKEFIDLALLSELIDRVDTTEFDEQMDNFMKFLQSRGIERGKGQTRSKYKQLTGYQIRFTNPKEKDLSDVLSVLADILGWDRVTPVPREYIEIQGERKRGNPHHCDFFEEVGLFSYAITNKNAVNYTIFKDSMQAGHLYCPEPY